MVLMVSAAVFTKGDPATKVTGSLEKITSRSITIKDDTSGSKDFTINEKTQYTVNNKSSKHITLKQGDKVTLEVDNKNVVLKVNVEENS